MKSTIFSVIVFVSFVLSGCSQQNVNPHLIMGDAFSDNFEVLYVKDVATPEGQIHVQVDLMNHTSSIQSFKYRIRWFDQEGMVIETPLSAWLKLSLKPDEIYTINAYSPSPNAINYDIQLLKAGKEDY